MGEGTFEIVRHSWCENVLRFQSSNFEWCQDNQIASIDVK